MKKKIFIIIAIWLFLSLAFGIVYTIKTAPKPKYKPIKYEGKMAKEPFKSIGMKLAEIALNNKKANFTPFFNELSEAGATNIKLEIEENKNPVEKTLPPVVIGKKVYKKATECAVLSYKHKENYYVVGKCR